MTRTFGVSALSQDLASWKVVHILQSPASHICALSASMLATAHGTRIEIWQLWAGELSSVRLPAAQPAGHPASVRQLLRISAAKPILASACESKVLLWDPEAKTQLAELSNCAGGARLADLGGGRLLTECLHDDRQCVWLRVWDAASGAQLAALQDGGDGGACCSSAPRWADCCRKQRQENGLL